MTTASAVIIS